MKFCERNRFLFDSDWNDLKRLRFVSSTTDDNSVTESDFNHEQKQRKLSQDFWCGTSRCQVGQKPLGGSSDVDNLLKKYHLALSQERVDARKV